MLNRTLMNVFILPSVIYSKDMVPGISTFTVADVKNSKIKCHNSDCCSYKERIAAKPTSIICSRTLTESIENSSITPEETIQLIIEGTFKKDIETEFYTICRTCWEELEFDNDIVIYYVTNKKNAEIGVEPCENNKNNERFGSSNRYCTEVFLNITVDQSGYKIPVIQKDKVQYLILFKTDKMIYLISPMDEIFTFLHITMIKEKEDLMVGLIHSPVFQSKYIGLKNSKLELKPLNELIYIHEEKILRASGEQVKNDEIEKEVKFIKEQPQ